jgi:hypothetical protein
MRCTKSFVNAMTYDRIVTTSWRVRLVVLAHIEICVVGVQSCLVESIVSLQGL